MTHSGPSCHEDFYKTLEAEMEMLWYHTHLV